MKSEINQPTSDDLVDIGEAHHKAGRVGEAESCYRQALDLDPGHPGALYYLANIAFADGRVDVAKALIEDLLHQEPTDAEAWQLLGMIAFKEGDLIQATQNFEKALTVHPTYALAHFSLGNVLSEQGDFFDKAVTHFQQAINLNPTFAEAYYSLGNMFRAKDRFDEAIENYQLAINAKSNFEPAYTEIGRTLFSLGKSDEAATFFRKVIEKNIGGVLPHITLGHLHFSNNHLDDAVICYKRALDLEPHCFTALFGLGDALFNQSKYREAILTYRHALALNSTDTRLLKNLATAFLNLGEIDEAIKIYQQWIDLEPDDPIARHHLAACTHKAVPTRADDAYVELTFDAFAENFDVVLEKLQYRAPELIAEAIERNCGFPSKQFAVLDAGCGTGLCGPLVAPYAASLIGVDLSEGMLAKAKLHNVYDSLVKAELTAYLKAQAQAFDVILSADTLVYFGALEEVVAASYEALRNNGYLFFSVEALAESANSIGYLLNSHGRYSHTESYIRRTLERAGFTIVAMDTAILRYQGELPVNGFVVSCRAQSSRTSTTVN